MLVPEYTHHNWPHYNGTALYTSMRFPNTIILSFFRPTGICLFVKSSFEERSILVSMDTQHIRRIFWYSVKHWGVPSYLVMHGSIIWKLFWKLKHVVREFPIVENYVLFILVTHFVDITVSLFSILSRWLYIILCTSIWYLLLGVAWTMPNYRNILMRQYW